MIQTASDLVRKAEQVKAHLLQTSQKLAELAVDLSGLNSKTDTDCKEPTPSPSSTIVVPPPPTPTIQPTPSQTPPPECEDVDVLSAEELARRFTNEDMLNKPQVLANMTIRGIDDRERLKRQYGGTEEEWSKMGLKRKYWFDLAEDLCAPGEKNQIQRFQANVSGDTEFDIHWYERQAPGQKKQRFEFKLKEQIK